MKNKIKAIYNSPVLIMYAIALAIWNNFVTYLSFFTAFDASYTAATAASAIKAIDAARLLPDASARRAISKKIRKLLRTAGKGCCNQFQVLLTYIEKSFPDDEIEAMKQLAGYASYKKASAGNLTQIAALNTAAATFLTDNSKALIAGGMPATFADTFTTTIAGFDELNSSYGVAIQKEREETNAKTAANNEVYTTLTRLIKDAKSIFINDATTRAFFTYDTIALRFKKEGKTGYRFTIRQVISEAAIHNAVVVFQPGNITAIANKKGVAQAELQKDVIYTFTITAPGSATVAGSDLKTTPGVMKRKEFLLTPAETSVSL